VKSPFSLTRCRMRCTKETHRYIIETPKAGRVLPLCEISKLPRTSQHILLYCTENTKARLTTGQTGSYKDGNRYPQITSLSEKDRSLSQNLTLFLPKYSKHKHQMAEWNRYLAIETYMELAPTKVAKLMKKLPNSIQEISKFQNRHLSKTVLYTRLWRQAS
jgi:hypothetical protein